MKRLIVTADDFGLAVPVNEAVERAHREGVLTCASLMVSAPEAKDAIERARRLPSLRVGLHLTLVRGVPALPTIEVRRLVDRNGGFFRNLVIAGFRFFFVPGIRAELERETRAQFEAFKSSRLLLDHVIVHNHMHLHPTVLNVILRVGRDYGMQSMRIPEEPRGSLFLRPWISIVRKRLRQSAVLSNDFVLGLRYSGEMDTRRVVSLLGRLPEGTTEMYFHPATATTPYIEQELPGYDVQAEFRALTDPLVRQAVQASGARLIAFSDLQKEVDQCSVS